MLLLGESFDFYSSSVASEAINNGGWTITTSLTDVTTSTAYSSGKAGKFTTTTYSTKSLLQNSTNTVYLSFRVYPIGTITAATTVWWRIGLNQGGTRQITIVGLYNGNILVYRGTDSGTLLGTWSSAFVGNTWTSFQAKIVIDPTTGEVRLRKNGGGSDELALTSANTRATSNAWADEIATSTGSSNQFYLDDLIVWDDSGAAPNGWAGEIRAYPLSPSGTGSASDLTASVAAIPFFSSGSSGTALANYIRFAPFTASYAAAVPKISIFFAANMTGKCKVGIYSDVAGQPSALIATSNEVTNPVSGSNDFTFSSPPSLTAGAAYWYAFHTDTNANIYESGSTGYRQSVSYVSGLPATASAGAGHMCLKATVHYTTTSVMNVQDTSPDGDASYNYGTSSPLADLYAMANLPANPATIYAVNVRAVARKTDVTTRALEVKVKSGATTVNKTAVNLGADYAGINYLLTTDPNTSAAWTASGVNAMEAGVNIST